MSRLENLANGAKQQVNDESIDDTLLDLANYALLALVERNYESGNFDCYTFGGEPKEDDKIVAYFVPNDEDAKPEKLEEPKEISLSDLIKELFNKESEENDDEAVFIDDVIVDGDPDLDDDDDDYDDDDDDHDIYDIYKELEEAYGSAQKTLDTLKKEKQIKEEDKKIQPKQESSFYQYSIKYNPETKSYDMYVNNNGKEEKKNISLDFSFEDEKNSKVKELEKKNIRPWDLGELCSFF